MLLFPAVSWAQNAEAHFTYDACGNRILKSLQLKKTEENGKNVEDRNAYVSKATEYIQETEIGLYPNPTEGRFTVTLSDTPNATMEAILATATGVVNTRAYLIVGSTGDITVPVDGIPVENDLNAVDGQVAYNVMNNGADTFTFYQLMGNSTYHFAIFPYNNSGENIDYKTDGNYPTAEVTIGDTYCPLQSNFANGLDPFEAVDIAGEQHWQTGLFDGVYYAKMNGYASGATHANEDWLISPNILEWGTFASLRLSFSNAAMYEGNDLLVKASYDYNGNPQSCTWIDITDMFDWSSGDYAWVDTEAELIQGKGPKLYIAFVYICDDVAATAWEIADVKVTASGFDAVGEQVVTSFSIYPNPAHEVVLFNLNNDAQVSVFDMTGRMVSVKNMTAGEAQYAVAGLESGVYFLNIRYADGKTAVARFVKY